MTTTLICPKCQGEMRTYERNGIQIDQCQECKGIFLDRGELDRLIDAESTSLESGGSYGRQERAPEPLSGGGHHGGGHGGYGKGKRRKGLLGELFD